VLAIDKGQNLWLLQVKTVSVGMRRTLVKYGLRPRMIGVCFQGTAPAGLSLNTTYDVAVLSPADFAAATITGTVAYQGQTAVVVTKTPESIFPGS